MDLQSRTCVITGGARGIGRAMAESLVARGARVVLADADEAALGEAVRALSPACAQAVVADVRTASDVDRIVAEATGDGVRIDVWINNAGLARHHPITDYTEDEIDRMLQVNLKGAILGSQHALLHMMPHRSGHIVNVVSTAGLRGIPTESVYCATKWGVRGFTEALQEEAAPFGIRVTALLPGGVDTSFWDDVGRVVDRGHMLKARHVAEALVAILELDDVCVARELVIRSLADHDFGTAGATTPEPR